MGKEEGCWLQGSGAATCPGLELSSRAWGGRTMRGPPAPPRGRCWWELPLPQACSFVCVRVCLLGGQGNSFVCFCFSFFFFWFGLWLAPGSRSVEGQRCQQRGARELSEGAERGRHGCGMGRVCGESLRGEESKMLGRDHQACFCLLSVGGKDSSQNTQGSPEKSLLLGEKLP